MHLIIENKRFEFFSDFNVSLAYDQVASTFSIGLYFDPNNADHRRLLRPGSYYKCQLWHERDVLITGYITACTFKHEATEQLAQISGYSLPGLLEDSSILVDDFALQSDGLNLLQITDKFVVAFGLSVTYDSWVFEDLQKTYETSAAKPEQTIREYLGQLATQRNIVLSHTPFGSLHYTRALIDNQVPEYRFLGGQPNISMQLAFNGQPMHSRLQVAKEADMEGGNAGQAEISNPYIPIYKSQFIEQRDGDDVDTAMVARMARNKQLENIALTITIEDWSMQDNFIIRPNTIISVKNPKIFIFQETEFFIKSVSYKGDAKSATATLQCVLPEVYSDKETVTNIFL